MSEEQEQRGGKEHSQDAVDDERTDEQAGPGLATPSVKAERSQVVVAGWVSVCLAIDGV